MVSQKSVTTKAAGTRCVTKEGVRKEFDTTR
jgi:hypothetical protein